MKNNSGNLSLFSQHKIIIITFAVILSHFPLIHAIRTASGNDGLLRTTRKPDYSDVYEKIDDNDIFKNVRRIMRIGDPANGVPVMAPFKRDHQFYTEPENELGNVEHQRVEGLDQFVTKSSLIYSNNEKFDFSLLWPKISFISRHSSTRNLRVFYSNYTFVGCTLKGEADVQRTSTEENCYKLRDLRLTLHFKNYDVNVVTTSNNENDKDIARTAKQTLDRYIKQEYTLGLEKPAYELEQKIKEYFGNYRCLLQEDPPIQRPSRKNDRDDRAFIDFEMAFTTERSTYQTQNGNRQNSRPSANEHGFNDNYNRPQNREPSNNQRDRERNLNDRRPSEPSYTNNGRNPTFENNFKSNAEPIYFSSDDNRHSQPTYNSNSQNVQRTQGTQTPEYPQSNRDYNTSTTRRTTNSSRRADPPRRTTTSSQSSNRPSMASSQVQTSFQTQTSLNPIYRTTTRTTTQTPVYRYYEYSSLI